MFNKRNTVCSIEIGTSKICVLVGEILADGRLEVIGKGVVPSGGTVVKGEIRDEGIKELLKTALDLADKSSGGNLNNCRQVAILVTGCGINSHLYSGSCNIENEEQIVTEFELDKAVQNALFSVRDDSGNEEIVNYTTTRFTLPGRGNGTFTDPLGQRGTLLAADVHVVRGIESRCNAFSKLVTDSGFENIPVELVFSPLADDMALLTDEERKQGVLLVNIGAGTTEYLLECDNGIQASGVLQIGMEHVANDLAIALGLKVDLCRKLIAEGILAEKLANNKDIDIKVQGGNIRRIPKTSFETVIDYRLREIFEYIEDCLQKANAPRNLEAGGILTGGGALFYRSEELFRQVFNLTCSIRRPANTGGIQFGLENPRYSSVWGGLKIAADRFRENSLDRTATDAVLDGLNQVWKNCFQTMRNIGKALKF